MPLYLIPIKPGTKKPLIAHKHGSASPKQHKAWAKQFPKCLWAVLCKPSGLLVIDVDVKKSKKYPDGTPGLVSYRKMIADHGPLPDTYIVETPSGGLHYYFQGQCGSPTPLDADHPGLDFRSAGKDFGAYVLYPPSKGYVVCNDTPIAQAPPWLLALAPLDKTTVKTEGAGVDDKDANVDRAERYLKRAKVAVEGDGGDARTYAVCAKLCGMGISEAAALGLLTLHWNPRCKPPWGLEALAVKVRNGYAYAQNAPGSETGDGPTAEEAFDVEPREGKPKRTLLELMNAKYAAVWSQGQCILYSRERDPLTGCSVFVRTTLPDMANFYANKKVTIPAKGEGGRVKYKTWDRFWIEHPERRSYRKVIFDPSKPSGDADDSKALNLWQGFGVKASKDGSWTLLRDVLIKEVLCRGVEAHVGYMMRWLAFLAQHPERHAEVAVVLRGGKGSGKGTLGRTLIRLFGVHATTVSSAGQLTGRFSSHLINTVFLFADEAFWAGDHAGEGRLKQLVTEGDVAHEEKFVRLTGPQKNRLSILMASNQDWVVPSGLGWERRWFVLDVSMDRAKDKAFFDALNAEMEKGGYENMLWELQHIDLGDWHPRRDLPVTEALKDQKRHSMDTVEEWWFDVVASGRAPEVWFGGDAPDWSAGPIEPITTAMHVHYVTTMRNLGRNRVKGDTQFAISIRKMLQFDTRQLGKGDMRGCRVWQIPDLKACELQVSALLE